MRLPCGKIFTLSLVILLAAVAFAHNHHALNGTWSLIPARSNFGGGPEIQNGSLTIKDREGNLYVSRNFDVENSGHGLNSYGFQADGPEHSTIRDGKEFRTKAHWEGDVLEVTTVQDGRTTVERFSLTPDGSLILVVDRQDMAPLTLMFRRVGLP